jgi:hypothetical protein
MPRLAPSRHHRYAAVRALTSSSKAEAVSAPPSLLQSFQGRQLSLTTSLGLVGAFVPPEILPTIRQLPEVNAVFLPLEETNPEGATTATNDQMTASDVNASSIRQLERAAEIFASAGGTMSAERVACLALLAELQHRRGEDCKPALQALKKQLQQQQIDDSSPATTSSSPSSKVAATVDLALAKVCWMGGDFDAAQKICDDLLDLEEERYTTSPTSSSNLDPWQRAAARTGQAVSRLLGMQCRDDAFSVRDPFRMVLRQLERAGPSPTPAMAAAHLNMGVAEAVWAETVGPEAPLDGAMRQWRDGRAVLQRIKKPSAAKTYLHAALTTNIAWGMLQMGTYPNHIDKASELASEALTAYDPSTGGAGAAQVQVGYPRTLTMMATCYHKSGGAVTAEGLFQTAIASAKISKPQKQQHHLDALTKVQHRDALQGYANLCNDWDRRESDAARLEAQASEMNDSLPGRWKCKSGIHSTLWFLTDPDLLSARR